MSDLDPARIRRAIVQHLHGFQQAGMTHWTKFEVVPDQPRSPSAPAAASKIQPPPPARVLSPKVTPHAVAAPVPTHREDPVPSAPKPQPNNLPTVLATVSPSANFQPLNLSRNERAVQLKVLSERVAACQRCHELASTRKQTVFGVGNPEAKIMFIGEAPGADEDAQGEPFVGRAGQLLNDIIKACRMRREDIYICNVLRCRPPGNRLPSPEEAGNCREYLDGQIALVNPEYIVCWGSTAAKNLLASEETIGKMRKRFFQYGRAKVLCTYHPSYLLRNPAAKKDVWDDMKLLFLDMGIDLTAKA